MSADLSPLTWERRSAGRIVGKLGVIDVAEVSPWLVGQTAHRAHWRVMLPGVFAAPRQARDLEDGQRQAEGAVMQWLEAAGLAPATLHEQTMRAWRAAVQAEAEP